MKVDANVPPQTMTKLAPERKIQKLSVAVKMAPKKRKTAPKKPMIVANDMHYPCFRSQFCGAKSCRMGLPPSGLFKT